MNDEVALEHRLASTYAVAPTEGFTSIDHRIASLTKHPEALRWPRRWSRLHAGLALVTAFFILAGAAAAMQLLDRVASGTPGTAVAWDQGIDIGQSEVHGDFSVTLARGYADINQVVLGVLVERVDGGGHPDAALVSELTDPAGVILPTGLAPTLGANDASGQAEMLTFAPTTSSDGDYSLRLGIADEGEKPDMAWMFEFELPAPAGAGVRVAQTKTTENGSVDVRDVRLSPTMLTASMHIEPADPDAANWSAIGYFEHSGRTIAIDWGAKRGPSDLDQTAGTYAGVENAGGDWKLVITELVGERPDDTQTRLEGPWEFTFSVP